MTDAPPMQAARFSLIIATIGRTEELAALFESLIAQQQGALDVIVVDQNADDRLTPIIAAYAECLAPRHLRLGRPHCNQARNLGLRHAQGEIVAFPDDDCVLPAGTLAQVAARFAAEPTLRILTGPAASPEGGLGSGRWRAEAGPITLANLWTSVIEFNLFVAREVAMAMGGFDERLGPGTAYGSAEGNDLVARALRAGYAARYEPSLRIIHPDKRLTPTAVARARLYGAGLGLALRRHAPLGAILPFMIRPLGGIALSLARARWLEATYYAATLRGRGAGLAASAIARDATLAPLEPA